MIRNIEESEEFRIKLGNNIRNARQKANLTQAQLGELLGKKDNVITNWEKGTNRPDADMIEKLCTILSISPNELLNWNKGKKEDPLAPIAAHFKGKEISEEKMKRIEKFIEFTLNEEE